MRVRRHRNANRFILTWIFYGFVVYFLAAVAVGIAGFAAIMLLNIFGLRNNFDGNGLIETVFMGVVGGAIGWAVGFLQTRALRDQLRWSADNWIRFSIIGGVIGGAVTGIFVELTQNNFAGLQNTQIRMMMLLFAGTISVFQWWALREAVKNASVWIVGNVVAAFVFGALVNTFAAPDLWCEFCDVEIRDWYWILNLILPPLMQAFLTGTVMLTLFERFAYPVERYGKRNTVVPKKAPEEKSIWDEAI